MNCATRITRSTAIPRATKPIVAKATATTKVPLINNDRKRKELANSENEIRTRQNPKAVPASRKFGVVNPPNRKVLSNVGNTTRAAALPMKKPQVTKSTHAALKQSKQVARVAPYKMEQSALQKPLEVRIPERIQLDQSPVPMDQDNPQIEAIPVVNSSLKSNYFDPNSYEEYAPFVYDYLRKIEAEYTISVSFLEHQSEVTYKMREILVDWLNEVHSGYGLVLETLFTAVGIVDTYLQYHNVPRNQFQLLGITALFLASKYEEVSPPEVEDFSYITDNYCTKDKIVKMEIKILRTLKFRMGRPLSLTFLQRVASLARVSQHDHKLAEYFLELSLLDHKLCYMNPSLLAAAACCLALKLGLSTWNTNLIEETGYSETELLAVMKQLAKRVSSAEKFHVSGTYTKYCSEVNLKVAKYPELRFCESVL